jgi:hypothetical protein
MIKSWNYRRPGYTGGELIRIDTNNAKLDFVYSTTNAEPYQWRTMI